MAGLGAWHYWGDLDPNNLEVVQLTIIMFPSLLFICLFGLNMGLLQCEHSYFIPSFAPVAFNIIWIFGVLWLKHLPGIHAMPYLAAIVVVACLAQWLITLPKTLAFCSFTTLSQHVSLFSSHVRKLLKPLSLGILGVAASQVNNAMDTVFARYADVEGPAELWYAIRIQQLPLALFGIALSGALLPPLSRAMKRGDLAQFVSFFSFSISRTIILMVPLTLSMVVWGGEIINLVYGHGGFTSSAAVDTTYCLWGYLFGLIPMTLTLILAPALYARNDYRTPTIASAVSMGLNIALNFIAIFILGWGPASVAVATSISAWVNCVQLAKGVSDQVEGAFKVKEILRSCWDISLWTLAAIMIALLSVAALFPSCSFFGLCFSDGYLFSRHLVDQLLQLAVPGLIFLTVMLVIWKVKSRKQKQKQVPSQ